MHKVRLGSVVGLSGILFALGACHHHPGSRHGHAEQEEHQRPELGSGLRTHHAVHSIATARCEREERCGNIGAGKSYGSMDACEAKIKADWAGDLNKYECPKGIVDVELDQCLAEVRTEHCGNPFDTLSRLAQCNASDICKSE